MNLFRRFIIIIIIIYTLATVIEAEGLLVAI